jgi:hypothetical protein
VTIDASGPVRPSAAPRLLRISDIPLQAPFAIVRRHACCVFQRSAPPIHSAPAITGTDRSKRGAKANRLSSSADSCRSSWVFRVCPPVICSVHRPVPHAEMFPSLPTCAFAHQLIRHRKFTRPVPIVLSSPSPPMFSSLPTVYVSFSSPTVFMLQLSSSSSSAQLQFSSSMISSTFRALVVGKSTINRILLDAILPRLPLTAPAPIAF